MSVQLLNSDCMEFMRSLPDNWADLAIVDPPYGRGEHGGTLMSRGDYRLGHSRAQNMRLGDDVGEGRSCAQDKAGRYENADHVEVSSARCARVSIDRGPRP